MGTMDTEEENDLYDEVDAISAAQETAGDENWDPEFEAAHLWNSAALQIVNVEQAYQMLYNILTPPIVCGRDVDPQLPLENIAQTLLALEVKAHKIDLDLIIDEVSKGVQHLKWLVPERHYEWDGKGIRLSALIATSKSFRTAILQMQVFEPLCDFAGSPVSKLFSYAQSRLLLEDCKIVKKKAGDLLFDEIRNPRPGYWTLLLDGEVKITSIINDVATAEGNTRQAVVFGAHSVLLGFKEQGNQKQNQQILRSSSMNKNLNTGVVIRAHEKCIVLQMKIAHLEEVCVQLKKMYNFKRVTLLLNEMLEAPDRPLDNLKAPDFSALCAIGTQPVVTEVKRKELRDAFVMLDNVWSVFSMGANTVPKGTLEMMRELLGEGGLQAFADVLKPMYGDGSPIEFRAETFFYCWTVFLSETCLDDTLQMSWVATGDEVPKTIYDQDSSLHGLSEAGPQEADTVKETHNAIFSESESVQDRLMIWMFADRRIVYRFVEVPILMQEREFVRVTGALTEPLRGDLIRQYLKYVMVDFPYPISIGNCCEFCELFDKRFDKDTRIAYQEIVRFTTARERSKHLVIIDTSVLFVGSSLNPNFILLKGLTFLMRLVVLYHFVMVPVRICFMPHQSFTSLSALETDLPADIAIIAHTLISLNTVDFPLLHERIYTYIHTCIHSNRSTYIYVYIYLY